MAGQSFPGCELAVLRLNNCHCERNEAKRNEVEEPLIAILFLYRTSKRCLPTYI
jgi:hypothetical protein